LVDFGVDGRQILKFTVKKREQDNKYYCSVKTAISRQFRYNYLRRKESELWTSAASIRVVKNTGKIIFYWMSDP